ncbi:MAG TPA: M48 family metalloprotease [Planctomycetota bacterium]|nr:M48 family metalloprotease [Planctomycetota bacterium]
MKRALCYGLLLLVPVAACAGVMNALEQATGENTAEGKLVRGANRLRKSFQDLDPSEEHYIGRSVAAQILAMPNYRLLDDAALTAYVNRVGQAVVMTNDGVRHTFADYHFAVLDTAEVNAFACPGGTVLVTRGLLQKTSSEDELAAVLAHEIAHVTLRHGLQAIQKANLAEAFTYLGAGAAQATINQQDLQKLTGLFDSSVKDIVQTLITSGYSRDAELAADQLGRKFAAGTGYDPQALGRVLAKMQQEGGNGGMFATHPAPQDRTQALGAPLAYGSDADAEQRRLQRYQRDLRF